MKRLPLSTPSPANFFLFGRACETDFFQYETAIFCGIVETNFQGRLRWGAEKGFHRRAKAFGCHEDFWGLVRCLEPFRRKGGHGTSSLVGEARETNRPPPAAGAGGEAREPFEAGAPPLRCSQTRAAVAASPPLTRSRCSLRSSPSPRPST